MELEDWKILCMQLTMDLINMYGVSKEDIFYDYQNAEFEEEYNKFEKDIIGD